VQEEKGRKEIRRKERKKESKNKTSLVRQVKNDGRKEEQEI
jgi:hypothetical protein